jgi:hypothetical protein
VTHSMAQLVDPDGKKQDVVSIGFAVRFIIRYPGWTWKKVEVRDGETN